MTITENLDAFLNDFGVTCTAGAVTALGILAMPSQAPLSGRCTPLIGELPDAWDAYLVEPKHPSRVFA